MWLWKTTHLLVLALWLTGASGWSLPSPRRGDKAPVAVVVSDSTRRSSLQNVGWIAAAAALVAIAPPTETAWAIPTIDVNNAMAREFTGFPGLYPTVATKIVNGAKEQPFKSKKEVYALLNELEADRLRQYDKSIVISKPDKALQQFKGSQICKYECGGRTSSSYRDEQIKAIQAARQGL
jgi:hypothetical protein